MIFLFVVAINLWEAERKYVLLRPSKFVAICCSGNRILMWPVERRQSKEEEAWTTNVLTYGDSTALDSSKKQPKSSHYATLESQMLFRASFTLRCQVTLAPSLFFQSGSP